MSEPEPVVCSCQACCYGLFCADGKRGVFERGTDECQLCGVVAWKHSNVQRHKS